MSEIPLGIEFGPKQLFEFLQVENVEFSDFPHVLANRIESLVGQNTRVWFKCPFISDSPGAELFIGFYSDDRAPASKHIEYESDVAEAGTLVCNLAQLAGDSWGDAIIVVELDHEIELEAGLFLKEIIQDFVKRVLQRQCGLIRRETVDAKVASNDLGSFLYRSLRDHKLHELAGARYASVFVRDSVGEMIYLRGTTGLARSDRRMSDIAFHIEENDKKIVEAHNNSEPRIEHDAGGDLDTNGISCEAVYDKTWTRSYWPIRLRNRGSKSSHKEAQRRNVGVIRLVNTAASNRRMLPFIWTDYYVMSFLSECIYNIVDAYVAADEASFKKDEAFHGSTSVVDTIAKNVQRIREAIYDQTAAPNPKTPSRFRLTPLNDNKVVDSQDIFHLLNTAYASAIDLGFQIERANMHVSEDSSAVTKLLVKNVLLRALELVPDMCIAHSVRQGYNIPQPHQLIHHAQKPLPHTVKGSPGALISVFANIFENSVKYRQPDSKVKIELDFEETSHDVFVRIRDYGIGIASEEELRVFTRGYRSRRARDYAPRGSGLGLWWCQSILKKFQGDISAERCDPGLRIIVRLAREL